MTHRRRGLFPRQRVRRPGPAAANGSAREPGLRQHRPAARHLRRVSDAGNVLRPRLGRRAFPAARAARSPTPATRSRRTATSIGWSTTRRRDAFRDDVRKAKALLEDASGVRRPSATVRRAIRSRPSSLWALDILIEEGYRYDSSIFPIRHDRYGIPAVAAASVPASIVTAGTLHRGAWHPRPDSGR